MLTLMLSNFVVDFVDERHCFSLWCCFQCLRNQLSKSFGLDVVEEERFQNLLEVSDRHD